MSRWQMARFVSLILVAAASSASLAQERTTGRPQPPRQRPSPSFSQGFSRPPTNQGMVTTRPAAGSQVNQRPAPRPNDRLPPGLAPSGGQRPARPTQPIARPQPIDTGRPRPTPQPNRPNRPDRPNVVVNKPTNIVNKPTNVDVHNRVTNITNNITNNNVYQDNRNIQRNNQNITIINNRPNTGPRYGAQRPWYNGWYQSGWNTGVQAPLWVNVPAGGGWFAASADQFGFSNPFWGANQTVASQYLNYSNRISVSTGGGFPAPDEALNQERALRRLDDARQLFRNGDYGGALEQIEQAIALVPNDPPLHEFRALCLFSLGQFPDSASALYAVLSSSPGWDGGTIRSLYGNLDEYSAHLANLERYLQRNPNSPEGHFLLAYHLATARQFEASLAELDVVQSLLPDDRLITQLREVLQAEVGA